MKQVFSTLFFGVVIFFFLISKPLFAEESSAESQQIEQKISLAETKLQHLQATQEKIFEKQAQIVEELASLKIWIRRNRS